MTAPILTPISNSWFSNIEMSGDFRQSIITSLPISFKVSRYPYCLGSVSVIAEKASSISLLDCLFIEVRPSLFFSFLYLSFGYWVVSTLGADDLSAASVNYSGYQSTRFHGKPTLAWKDKLRETTEGSSIFWMFRHFYQLLSNSDLRAAYVFMSFHVLVMFHRQSHIVAQGYGWNLSTITLCYSLAITLVSILRYSGEFIPALVHLDKLVFLDKTHI